MGRGFFLRGCVAGLGTRQGYSMSGEFGGRDPQLDDALFLRRIQLGAGGDPAAENLVVVAADLHAFAAAVADPAGRLQKKQASLRRLQIHAATACLAQESLMIETWIGAEQ